VSKEDDTVVVCCKCGKLRIKRNGVKIWIHAVAPGYSRLSHSYCPECAEGAMEEIDALGSECSG